MNGVQLAGRTCGRPTSTTSKTIPTLRMMIRLLTLADSLIPMTSTADISATMPTAGRLTIAPVRFSPGWGATHRVSGHLGQGAQLRRRGGEARGDPDAEQSQQGHEMARPADTHRGSAGGVFEHQVPADDPGRELAHGGVGVGVGAARDRHGARHLGVAETGERTRDADEDHREGHRGTGVQRGHLPGDHEDPGAPPRGQPRWVCLIEHSAYTSISPGTRGSGSRSSAAPTSTPCEPRSMKRHPAGTWVFRGVPLADSYTGRVCLRRPAAREASGPRAAMSAADPGPAARGLPGRRPTLVKGRAYRASWCGSGGTGRVGCRSRESRPRRRETMAALRGRGPD